MAKTSMKLKQARTPKFSTRAYTRCRLCGRPHSVLRKYGVCRICFRERVEAGLVDPQDLLMAEVKLNEAEYQLLQAKSSLETGRMALNP